MITKLLIESSRAIDFGAYVLPASKYEGIGITRYHIRKIQKRSSDIINKGFAGKIEWLVMRPPFY